MEIGRGVGVSSQSLQNILFSPDPYASHGQVFGLERSTSPEIPLFHTFLDKL